jgi:hypothetical protein
MQQDVMCIHAEGLFFGCLLGMHLGMLPPRSLAWQCCACPGEMQQDVLLCAFLQKGICVATLAVAFGEDVQFVVDLGMLAGALHGRLKDQFSVL